MTDSHIPKNKPPGPGNQPSKEPDGSVSQNTDSLVRCLLDDEQTGLIVIDIENQYIVDANSAAQEIMQADIEQIVGAQCCQFFRSLDCEPLRCPIHNPEMINSSIDCLLLSARGDPIPLRKSATQIRIAGKNYLVETFHRVAERRQAEQYLLEQKTLAEALRDTAKVINQSLNLKEVLFHILNGIGKVVPHDSANVMLLENNIARMTAWHGYDNLIGVQLSEQRRPIEEVPNLKLMADTGMPIIVPNTDTSPNWVHLESSVWIKSYVSAPICRNGKTIGFLNLNSGTPGFYSTQHAERLLAFADQAAIAIENASLYERAQQELEERKRAEEALQLAKSELEERVTQRTIELRSSNEQLREELARRKQAELALGQERAMLALRVEERTAELIAANLELGKAAEMKDSFLASMSHELRTPLSAILNLSETLIENLYGPLTPAQEKSLKTIQKSGEHLLVLINDMLDLSKIGAGQLELIMDEVDVNALCQSSLDAIHDVVRKKQMIVSTTIDPQVKLIWADPRRIKQILINLLNNAVKFTPVGGAIGLVVTADREKKQVNITVWDNGIGIASEKMKLLFKPFIQLDSRLARNYEGTGLGLALVYKLVELHNGGINLDSDIGLGSRFTVSLKWQDESGEAPGIKAGSVRDAALPIDPALETDITLHFRRCMDELNIEAVSYWYEKEAVLKAIEVGYELFVMDVRLLSQGIELLTLMKKAVETTRTPILFLTHQNSMMERPNLPAITNFLDFPFAPKEVRKVIRSIVPQGTASLVRKVAVFVERKVASSERRPLILVADDNPISVRTFIDYLSTLGYQVSFASSGAEALERARAIVPDVILMDIQMQGMDGIEATRRIRKDARLKDVPVIAITALVLPGDRQRCLEAGANDFLSKPFNMKKLEEVIEYQLVRQGRLQGQAQVDSRRYS